MKKGIDLPTFAFTDREIEIAKILARWGAKKKELGVIELTLGFGEDCWRKGREEMWKEVCKKLEENGIDPLNAKSI